LKNAALKINATKYSGLPLRSLEFLVKTNAPIHQMKKREVWKELYYRYFTQGRHFNLYRILSGEPIPFANTIGWELSEEEVEIPTEHAEDFIKNLLEFMEFLNRRVLESNLEFEWQLHELAGLKSMIERVRDAKIKDLNTRQKINLFIDKMNAARDKALRQIKIAKEVANSAEQEMAQDQQIVVSEERLALMKQRLVHLNIPISKITKKQWLDMINNLHIYYPEDQKRLVRHGIKKYPDIISTKHPCLTFIENRVIRNPEINMLYVLFKSLDETNLDYWFRQLPSVKGFLDYIRDWFFEAENATEENFQLIRQELLCRLGGIPYRKLDYRVDPIYYEAKHMYDREYLLPELDRHFWIVEQHENGKLSDMFQPAPNGTSAHFENESYRILGIRYTPSGNLHITEKKNEKEPLSILDLYYSVLKKMDRLLARNDEAYLRLAEPFSVSKTVPDDYHSKVRRFFQLPVTLVIDPDCAYKPDRPKTSSTSIEAVFTYKFLRKAVSISELQWLYNSDEGYAFFKNHTNNFKSSGMYHSHLDFLAEFLGEALMLFDFRDQDQLRRFFRLDFNSDHFFGPVSKIKHDVAKCIVQKLQEEVPHELHLVYEFFDGIEEEYKDFELYPEFEGLSPLELLLLHKHGVEVGAEKQYKGYKETWGSTTIHYTPEEARTRFIIDYFKNYYGE
jgi:hypothetical protein